MSEPCCKRVPEPGPWKAGVDDSADPDMVGRMYLVQSRLSNQMSNEDLIFACRSSANLDQRTRLGYAIQCCVLHNAAARIALLAHGTNPSPWRGLRGRIADAWEVIAGRGVMVRLREDA